MLSLPDMTCANDIVIDFKKTEEKIRKKLWVRKTDYARPLNDKCVMRRTKRGLGRTIPYSQASNQ